ncbi:MAG: glycosyltransferase [Candidatus Bathyarchaeota archaeon]|nr:glycosyltransferase [Candidatus Bathyarchaeota archaeon]
MVVTFPSFPSDYVNALVDSTSHLSMKYELILLTESVDSSTDVNQVLSEMTRDKQNLIKTRLVLMDPQHGKGLAFGRNLGSMLSDSSILLFVDDDTLILDDISSLITLLHTGKCYGVQPLLVNFDLQTVDSMGDYIKKVDEYRYTPYCRRQGENIRALSKMEADEIPYLRGAFMLIRKDALMNIGGFDETFAFDYDDVDFGFRMVCAGYKLIFSPQVNAAHKGGRTSQKMDDKQIRLSVLNTHSMYLKIAPYSFWPYIVFAYFERSLLRYEISRVKQKDSVHSVTWDFFVMHKHFIGRIRKARQHREILKKLGIVGRHKLDAMASGKKFPFSDFIGFSDDWNSK